MFRAPLRATLVALLALAGTAGSAPAQHASPDSIVARANASRTRGSEGARVTIVELSDFQCPFCRQFSAGTLAALDSAYIRPGKARLVFYNLPLPDHPAAWGAAEAALCAGAQGSFWPMHDRLFADQASWSTAERPLERFEAYAAALALDPAAFQECTRNDRVAPLIIADLMQGSRGGVSATPTFVVMREAREGEDPQAVQRVLSGVQSFAQFQQTIEELLK